MILADAAASLNNFYSRASYEARRIRILLFPVLPSYFYSRASYEARQKLVFEIDYIS